MRVQREKVEKVNEVIRKSQKEMGQDKSRRSEGSP